MGWTYSHLTVVDKKVWVAVFFLACMFLSGRFHYQHIVVWLLSRVLLSHNPMDCRAPDSSVHGISHTSILAAIAAKSLQSCPTLCDPIDGSPPGSSVPGILQARTLEWVAISFSNACMHAKSLQVCPTLCDPRDSSPPGSSVHRILQARILEWVAISFSSYKVRPPKNFKL